MDSNITINIVEPGSGPVVPNTGLFTSSIGGPEITTISISAVLILTMVAIIITALLYRKQKKSGKVTKLVHIVDTTKAVLKSKKRVTAGLSAIALLASAGTLTTLLTNAGKSNTNAVEEDGLTLDVSSEDFTIEVGDEPVFAVLPVELTVEEAAQAGYTLTAYTDSTDLVSTTNPDNIIPMVTLPESSVETLESSEVAGELSALANNTYGLALDEEPTTKDAEVYMPISTDSDAPTILKATDFVGTEANDTTTIYYGFYITPDVPYGTYTSTNINYNVEPHYITNLSFNGNGNDGGETIEGMTIIAGDTIILPENTYTKEGYNFIGWNTVAEPTEQDPGESYADQAEYTAVEGETKDVTLYAQWEELCSANSICYNANGADGTTTMGNQSVESDASVTLWASNYSYSGHGFVGWSEDSDAWNHLIDADAGNNSVIYGPNQTIDTGDLSSEGIKLYAIWVESAGNLQNWSSCSSLTPTVYNAETGALEVSANTITALTDNRDNNVYMVARLADGNCWMAENLRLDNSANISTSNTNNPFTIDGSVVIKNNDGGTSNKLSPSSSNWCTNVNAECYNQSYLNAQNIANIVQVMEEADNNVYAYGNYYNLYSATAGKGTYEMSMQGKNDLDGDICPSGWKLPLGSDSQVVNDSFINLSYAMGGSGGWESTEVSNRWRSFPNNFVYSGYYWGSSSSSRGDNGLYYTSTTDNMYSGQLAGAYLMKIADSYVYNGDVESGMSGLTLRCLISQSN